MWIRVEMGLEPVGSGVEFLVYIAVKVVLWVLGRHDSAAGTVVGWYCSSSSGTVVVVVVVVEIE